MKDTKVSPSGSGWSFELNYLRFYQTKADFVAGNIEQYGSLVDEFQFLKGQISEIREDAGDDGLSRTDKRAIHNYQSSMEDVLDTLDSLPDLSKMLDRFERLNDKIEHHADMWGIDHW